MGHRLELISPMLEILEIEVSNILYNPGNIEKLIFCISSYPGNVGHLSFSIFYYPGKIGKVNFPMFYYPGNIWQSNFSYLLMILKPFFTAVWAGGRRGGVGVGGRGGGRGRGRAGRRAVNLCLPCLCRRTMILTTGYIILTLTNLIPCKTRKGQLQREYE